MEQTAVPVNVKVIAAGKVRRYHGVSVFRQLLDIPTTLYNLRDLFLIATGLMQSLLLIFRGRFDVVFTKGGYVCLPVGIAARMCRIPLVIHDSDAHPGLTNRILARWAVAIGTGSPLENYPYPGVKTRYVGIPVDAAFKPFDITKQRHAKEALGFPDINRPLLVVTGGGLGARRINTAVLSVAQNLIDAGISIFHITGTAEFDTVKNRAYDSVHYVIVPFVSEHMAETMGAADVVVTRAGATTMLELAGLAKATIIIPNPLLTGGHQLKNAAVYEKSGAAIVLDELELEQRSLLLIETVQSIMQDPTRKQRMQSALHEFAKPDAALDMALMIAKFSGQGRAKAGEQR